MKMKLSELRKVIRQVLSEMPFREVLPSANISSKNDQPESGPSSFRAVDRFHRTPQFQKKAIAAFRGLPIEAYFLPIKIDKNLPFLQDTRLTVEKPAKGIRLLKQIGADVDFEDLQAKLAGGATVFLSFVEKLQAGLLPTPWMTIHAMLDNSEAEGNSVLDALRYKIQDWIEEEEPYTDDDELQEIMTMGSARSGLLRGAATSDIISELMTQEIATRRGIVFAYPSDMDPEKKEKFMNLEKFIKSLDIKSKFSKVVGGKLVFVQNDFVY